MTTFTTFYLSRVIGKKAFDTAGKYIGIVNDLLIDYNASNNSLGRPLVNGIEIKFQKKVIFYSFHGFQIEKIQGKMKVTCKELIPLSIEYIENDYHLVDTFLDRQIVDLNGRKLVRVNDIRLVTITTGTFAVAVDVGMEGLLRRIGIVKPIKYIISKFGGNLPAKFILWEDIEAVDFSNLNIRLSKSHSKLETLHPSDLADIIEELGRKESAEVFSLLNEEKAADVLEELKIVTQVHILESLSIEKAADVLEKMPADEVADILDALDEERAELLLNEMEKYASQEVRGLLEYPDNSVGSIMTTEILSFNENKSVEEVLLEIRQKKPNAETLYNLFVTDEKEVLKATFSLRDIVVSNPEDKIYQIMQPSIAHLHDYQKVDRIAEIISKYNLLAIPVVNNRHVLQGMVVIDDVVEDLTNKRRTNK